MRLLLLDCGSRPCQLLPCIKVCALGSAELPAAVEYASCCFELVMSACMHVVTLYAVFQIFLTHDGTQRSPAAAVAGMYRTPVPFCLHMASRLHVHVHLHLRAQHFHHQVDGVFISWFCRYSSDPRSALLTHGACFPPRLLTATRQLGAYSNAGYCCHHCDT